MGGYFASQKKAINKVIEDQRNQGKVKGSLEADITIYADQSIYDSLEKLGQELRFVTITSKAVLLPIQQASDDAVDSILDALKSLLIDPKLTNVFVAGTLLMMWVAMKSTRQSAVAVLRI